jgi:glycogen debranching enzyme
VSSLEQLALLLSGEGWPYASLPPQEPGDPGRFHALFGRDALITALQVLPAAPEVARATLRALAALRAEADDPELDAQPGKILHEYRPVAEARFAAMGWPVRSGALLYYGSADATSWFLVVLGRLGDAALASELESAWHAAGRWLADALDAGGGLVRHGPRPPGSGGLAQQGWRDAIAPVADHPEGAGIVRPDGSAPTPPLADADSQAVAVAALDALAALDPGGDWAARATALRARLSAWGAEVMAEEGDGTPVTGAGSQLGWLLWARALDAGATAAAVERLSRPDVLTAYGLRTLSSDHPAFRPGAYHRGGIWPFDCWLGWGGLRAAAAAEVAEQVRAGVLSALDALGLAPELYAVSAAGELQPVAVANRVQAWTVGARWALEQGWDGGAADAGA